MSTILREEFSGYARLPVLQPWLIWRTVSPRPSHPFFFIAPVPVLRFCCSMPRVPLTTALQLRSRSAQPFPPVSYLFFNGVASSAQERVCVDDVHVYTSLKCLCWPTRRLMHQPDKMAKICIGLMLTI